MAIIGLAVAASVALAPLAGFVAGALAVSTVVATAIASVAISVAMGVIMKVSGFAKIGAPRASIGPPHVFRQPISDSFIIYGKRRVGGLMVFFHPRKVGKDHYRYFVIACAGHRCQGVTKWFLNDEEVTVNAGTGAVTSGPYAGAAWLWFQRGLASETANATFVSECGGKWTSAHKGNGIAGIYAKFKMTDAVVEAGMPNITAEIEGKDDIFDPRDDTTGYTNNATLVFYDWMQIPREEGGFGAYEDEIPDEDYISAQANVCDETVSGEARYAIDGVIVTGAAPSEIRDVMVVNCAGSFTYSGGKFLMRPGYYVPPSNTLSEGDLAGPIQVSPFLASDQSANEVQGTYVNPDDGYQGAAFATQTTDPAPADIRQLDLELAFVTSKHRAERIARIMLNRAQAEKTVLWPMNITGLKVQALDTVQLDTSRYGLSNYAFQVVNWSLSSDFGVVLSLREENEDIYEAPTPTAPASIPAIASADPFLTQREMASLIGGSSTSPTRVLTASEGGGTATITVLAHDRVYPDGSTVSIAQQVFSGLVTDTPYFPYYEDDTLSDTTPTIVMTTDSGAVQGLPAGHSLGRIRTPIAASGITYEGGGAFMPGATVGREVDGPIP